MPLPDGLATVTVTVGPYLAPDGSPAAGTVTFQPETRAVHTPSGAVLLPSPVVVILDGGGAGTVTLPASDAPGVVPTGLPYWVFWRLTGQPSPEPLRVLLPAAAPAVDLDLLLPATSLAGPTSLPGVLSVAGLTGTPTAQQLAAVLAGKLDDTVTTMRRYYAGTYTTTNNTTQTVNLNATDFGRGSGLTISGGSIVVDRDGVYVVTAEISFSGGTSGPRTGLIRVNGATVREFSGNGTDVRVSGAATLVLAAGQAVGLATYNTGAPTLAGTAYKDVGLTVTRVGS